MKSWFNQLCALAAFYNEGGLRRALRRRLNFAGSSRFEDRSGGRDRLVLVVAGHKPDFWELTLPRIARFLPEQTDVCMVCPGADDPRLAEWCGSHGWSQLVTRANRLALAQNLALRAFPRARWIHKLDEDMFIAEGYFGRLEKCYATAAGAGPEPGFVAPLINLNGYSHAPLLEILGKTAEFTARFGPPRQSCRDTPAWSDPQAGVYLWEMLRPFDGTAARLLAGGAGWSRCWHRFSIGAFLMARATWEAMGGFTVAGEGVLGMEEGDLCAWCVENSRPMVVCHEVLAGHGGFQPQAGRVCRELAGWEELRAIF